MAEAVGKPGAAGKQGPIRNVLFIMADQFRWDYMGCAGHPTLSTPALDGLARRGVRFTNAYVQSAICGPSRMSFYSGLYMANHGATLNGVPLPVGTKTLGDYLRPMGVRTALAGKTHMSADKSGIERLGLTGVEGVFAPAITIAGVEIDRWTTPGYFYWLCLIVVILVTLAYKNLLRSPTGRAFTAIRDSEVSARAMGVNVARYKTLAFGISCFFTGLAGALLAHFLQAFNYEAFLILISIQLLLMVTVGGPSSMRAPMIAVRSAVAFCSPSGQPGWVGHEPLTMPAHSLPNCRPNTLYEPMICPAVTSFSSPHPNPRPVRA